MAALQSTLELVEREIARSEAFLTGRNEDDLAHHVHVDRRRRDDLVQELLNDRRSRLEKRLKESASVGAALPGHAEARYGAAQPEPPAGAAEAPAGAARRLSGSPGSRPAPAGLPLETTFYAHYSSYAAPLSPGADASIESDSLSPEQTEEDLPPAEKRAPPVAAAAPAPRGAAAARLSYKPPPRRGGSVPRAGAGGKFPPARVGARPRPKSAPRRVSANFAAAAPEPSAGEVSYASSSSNRVPSSKLKREDEWALRERQKKSQLEKQREAQAKSEVAECTFRPVINQRSAALSKHGARAASREPFVERLHHEADTRLHLRAKARELLEEEKVAGQTFQPKIKEHPASAHQRPIHERLDDIMRRKKENINLRRVEQELTDNDLTFAPKLAVKSEQMVQRAREKAVFTGKDTNVLHPVEDRLGLRSTSRSNLERPEQVRAGPRLSEEDAAKRFDDFLKRQEQFAAAREMNRENHRLDLDEPCTFQPKLALRSEVLVDANHRFWGETQQDIVTRLAVSDAQRRVELREELGREAYADCSFQPKVTQGRGPTHPGAPKVPQGRAGSRIKPAGDAAGKTDGGEGKENVEEEDLDVHERLHRTSTLAADKVDKEKPLDDECTFAPKVDQPGKFKHVKAHYDFKDPNLAAAIKDELVEKAHRRMEGARTKDEDLLTDCTFQPRHSAEKRVEAEGPVVVRGLGRFLELKELARRQAAGPPQKKRAIERVGPVTIPEPFHLSTASLRSHRCLPEEAPFRPTTNESLRHEKVLRILEERGVLGYDVA